MITEEQKQEADLIIKKHSQGIILGDNNSVLHAIQDRQSVLEVLDEIEDDFYTNPIRQSLTNQIDYLKTKI